MINWLPTPGIDVCSCKCLEISQGLVQEMNVKSTYLPHYCSVKSSLSAGVWGSGMQLTSALHTLYFALCFNGRSCSTTFPECPWVYTQSVWTFWIRDMIWLPNVLWMTCESKRHFKMVLISQWCFARQWFLFLSSFCFAVVVLVLCFVKVTVMKRGERCNSTYLVNRKVIICCGDERQDSKSLNWSSLRYSADAVSQKSWGVVLLINLDGSY